jgi:hypothetical protein
VTPIKCSAPATAATPRKATKSSVEPSRRTEAQAKATQAGSRQNLPLCRPHSNPTPIRQLKKTLSKKFSARKNGLPAGDNQRRVDQHAANLGVLCQELNRNDRPKVTYRRESLCAGLPVPHKRCSSATSDFWGKVPGMHRGSSLRLELFFFDDHIAALLGGRLPTRTDLPACRGMLSGSASAKASLCFSPPDNLWSQGASSSRRGT